MDRRRLVTMLLLAALAGCSGASVPVPVPGWGRARTAEAPRAMVVSGSPIASDVGRDILRHGGNAVDAAVAVAFALAVVHPEAGNLGGGGFMLIRTRAGEVSALDYRETAPAAATRDMYLDASGQRTDRSVTGHLASGVPGTVAGLVEAHGRFGKLPWRDLLAPAVELARRGFVIDSYRAVSLASDTSRLRRFPASVTAFLPGGDPPVRGSTLRQPDLAATLERVRDSGSAGFYRGRTAGLIVAEMERGGGIISAADLAGYQARWRDPIRTTYRGHTVFSMAPVSSGGVTLALLLNIMEGWSGLRFGSPDLLHREAEAMRRAFTERNRSLGDPAFVSLPLARLLSKEFAATLRGQIDLEKATPTPAFDPTLRDGESTTHFSIVDADGMAVSSTTTLNNSYGSAVTVTGAGFLLNDEMDDFATAPGKPNMYGLVEGEANAIAPGKRMLSAMTPSMVVDSSGNLLLVVGTPGGPTIITQVYRVISNVIDHRMALARAIEAPRLHHQALPDRIQLERGGFPDSVIARLRAMGHEVSLRGPMGDVEAIMRSSKGWLGVSDPRRGGGPAGY
jgi:gamma-glutamyltranspeptidase/glutathione hydrolase